MSTELGLDLEKVAGIWSGESTASTKFETAPSEKSIPLIRIWTTTVKTWFTSRRVIVGEKWPRVKSENQQKSDEPGAVRNFQKNQQWDMCSNKVGTCPSFPQVLLG